MMRRCQCGQRFREPYTLPLHCACGRIYDTASGVQACEPVAERQAPKLEPCDYRIDPNVRLARNMAGCGCGSVAMYRCRLYSESVTLKPFPTEHGIELAFAWPQLAEKHAKLRNMPPFKNRACLKCPDKCHIKPPAAAKPQSVDVSVIVTCHNYGRYLRQCLNSILSQTHQASSVVLVDDASSDDTSAIAAEYATRGVRYLRGEWRDVAQARNAGTALTESAYVLNVDADNWLPRNYLAELLASMGDPPCGVAYSHLERFTDDGRQLGRNLAVVPYDYQQLRRGNIADTCSLVRRQSLIQVGGWRSGMDGLHDWDLWLRITAAGWTMRLCDTTALHYRVHPTQMTEQYRQPESRLHVMQSAMMTTIICLFSGREWMLDRWFASLAAVRWPRESLHLVALDNSRNETFGGLLREYLVAYGITHTYLADNRRVVEKLPSDQFTDSAQDRIRNHRQMGEHLARLYSLAGRQMPAGTDLVWSIEDDVGFPPDALSQLATELFRRSAAACGGLMRNRFFERNLLYQVDRQSFKNPPTEPVSVTETGFYCLLLRRDDWDRIAWRAGDDPSHPFYDWSACRDLRATGLPIWVLPAVRCQHWTATGEAINV